MTLSMLLPYCPSLLMLLQSGKSVDVPVYDFTRHARSEQTRRVRLLLLLGAAAYAVCRPCFAVCGSVGSGLISAASV